MSLWFFRRNSGLTSPAEGIYGVCECMFVRASPESLSCVIIERKYVFAHRKVLNECSASQDITGTGSTIILTNIFLTFGKRTGIAYVERQFVVFQGDLFHQNVNARVQAQPWQQMETSNHL